ncbi:hypothetical protein MesoLjLb_49820 [Mesorhizobium sp. L-8-3]|nr:hypothetical protein MesoLjLb_49820 [Mesorhizobium sp. L-8-3]
MRLSRASRVACASLAVAAFAALTSSQAAEAECYRVVNVDLWDVLYIRSRQDHRSKPAGAIAPDHTGIIHATGACRPQGASRKRQWCPVDYYPLPTVRITGYVKAYFVVTAACPPGQMPVP